MPTANSPASKEVVTAALLVIGGKILSGRTKDQNIGYVAEYLTAVGVDLKEVRVVGDEERAIVDALNVLRHRYTYIFTTGGIGPTHGDITTDCVAKAFGVPIETDPRALAILHEWVKTTGAEMNEARLRMTRIPKGADLILNKVSGTPGFWIGNVIVMAGVPSIMQAMLDEVSPKLATGVGMLSETVRADVREGDIGMQLGEIARANPEVAIGSGICVRLRQRPAPPALRWPHWKFGVCRILLPVSRRLGLARICSVRSAPKHAPTDTLSCLPAMFMPTVNSSIMAVSFRRRQLDVVPGSVSSSCENRTCRISFVVTLPLPFFSTRTSCCASGRPAGMTIFPPAFN
jgi:molybdopterin-biosynthesis enzyme MoeA-like protein